jgi:photosystem II stability/assembly factor-like uncharacterized protein
VAKRIKKVATKSRGKKAKPTPRKSAQTDGPLAPGPRKNKLAGKLGHVSRNHKRRSTWFQARASWPLREACVGKLVSERARVENEVAPAPGMAQWENIGPTNIGGRITSLVCDPAKPDSIWAGAAGGGVWQSTDAGRSWKSLWHLQSVLNIGSLAIHPTNPKILYCGTGEANLSADSYAGVGLYRTTNGGKTWTLLASSEKAGIPSRIGVIAVDPHDPNHIRIGGIGFGKTSPQEHGFGGMYTSRDAGKTWTRESFISVQNYWCHSIVFHPAQPQRIFATFTAQGVSNGIWRSTDGGATWSHLTNGLPAPAQFNRSIIALAPSDPNVLYLQVAATSESVLGIFRTSDGGNTWKSIAGTHFAKEGQMTYGNSIVVHPTNPNYVLCGGVDLHLTTNGGTKWDKVTRWDSDRGKPNYAHADHHALLMPAALPGRVYDGNDGGMDMSDDGGINWQNRSVGLGCTMYYDLDVAPSDPLSFGGGAQDNGTVVTRTGGSNDHFEILGGDGGWMVYHPTKANQVYASYYNMNIFRFRGSQSKDVSPPASESEKGNVWMVYITLDPNKPSTVFTGSSRVWRSKDDGDTWKAVSGSLDGSSISAIEVAPADSQRIYVGTENGGFFRSLDGGTTWSPNMAGPELPGVTITRLESSPTKADVVFVTIANFGNSHVFRSDDGGAHWNDVDGGRLPDVPHHAVVVSPDDPKTVYVASDAGIHVSKDLGGTWSSLKRNLPNTMCVDLVFHQGAGTLTTATYGRSIWRLKVRGAS